MKNEFVKMHGLGNDFAIFDGRAEKVDFTTAQIQAMGDRRTGIGFDQMVIIDPPKSADTDAFMRIYNADGGEVGACGNVSRCVAKMLINETKKESVFLETKTAKLEGKMKGDKVTVDMGLVYLEWQQIPLSHEENTLDLSAVAEGVLKHPVAVNVGNPHAVFFLQHKEIEDVPLEKLGPRVENHALFPEKVNVEVAHVLERDRVRMRVWERGVGITRACGTGACAVVVAGVRRGLTDRRATVELDGGELEIEWRESDNHVLMTGPVAESFRGEIEI